MSPPLLECLDALSRLEREKPPARLASLAKRLGLDRAAAVERVAAIEAQGLVHTDPASCPHGNPIPSADGALAVEHGTPLHRLKPGQGGIILRVEREEPELLKSLATLGLLPQTKVEVEERAPFGGPILVRVGSARYALGRKVAAHVLVREV